MKNSLKIIITVLFIVTFAGCSLFSKRYTKNITGENRITASGKKSFKLNNINGRIKISHTDDPFIIVKYDVSLKVKKNDLDDQVKLIGVKIDSLSPNVNVEVEMPEEHGLVIFDNSSKANFEIFVPDGIDVSIDNTNGNLIFNEMTNNINAEVINGNVDLIDDSGNAKVDITNGSFHGVIDSTKGLSVETINGSIRVNAKKNFAGQINSSSVHGKFTYEGLEFTKVRSTDKKDFEGDIGTSTSKIKFSTTNGNVNIISVEKK